MGDALGQTVELVAGERSGRRAVVVVLAHVDGWQIVDERIFLERGAALSAADGAETHQVVGVDALDQCRDVGREVAQDECRFGAARQAVADHRLHLGLVHQDAGEYELARAAFAESLDIIERSDGADSPLAAIPLDNLGQILRQLGRPQEAIAMILREVERSGVLGAIDALGLALAWGMVGKLPEARANLAGTLNGADGAMAQLQATGMTSEQARGTIERMVDAQAATIGANHLFSIAAVVLFVGAWLVWLAPRPKTKPGQAAMGH